MDSLYVIERKKKFKKQVFTHDYIYIKCPFYSLHQLFSMKNDYTKRNKEKKNDEEVESIYHIIMCIKVPFLHNTQLRCVYTFGITITFLPVSTF